VVTPQVRWRDAVLPAVLALLVVLELAALDAPGRVAAGAVLVLTCAVLVPRRRWPLVCGTLAGVLCTVPPWIGPAIEDVATPILILALASYSLARWIESYLGLVGLGIVLFSLSFDYVTVDARAHDVTDVVFLLALLVPPYVVGRVTKRLSDYGQLLEREQELVRHAAVRDERDRIARELHDVIAHSVSAMVVQVAVAKDLVRRDPDRAVEVLDATADTGRRALAETGRLLHVIRDSADELGLTPVPGLADLAELVDGFRKRGLQVDLRTSGDLLDLPVGVDVSAYRIVQEALTNAHRYSSDGTTVLCLDLAPGAVAISATNPTSGSTGTGSGLGLAGMAERVALLGGSLTTRAEGGHFTLDARLPVDVEETVGGSA